MMKGRPISTAPRDGTVVLVWAEDYNEDSPYRMRYDPRGYNILGYRDESSPPLGLWVAEDGSFTWTESEDSGPTHWCPLVNN